MRYWILAILLACAVQPVISAQDSAGSGRALANRTTPIYPELAHRLNLEGTVKLLVTVAADGRVKSDEVLGGNPVLARAAQDAVSHWRWAAGPRETRESVEVAFHNR
jgi:TonB family protein